MPEKFDQAAYIADYHKAKTTIKTIRLSYQYDADILRRFEEVGNVAGYIKRLVRDDIRREEQDRSEG